MFPTFVLLVFVFTSSLAFFSQDVEAASCVLNVDIASVKGPATFRASGFLHGISASGPPQELVEPLKPRLFRALVQDVGFLDRPGIYERATAMGAKIQVDLGSAHGCPATGPCPGDDGDWSSWERALDNVLSAAKQKGYRVQWDIWNEPNLSEYWARDYDRYLEMWRRTVKKIRSVDPKAEIVGPSICGYDAEWLRRFLLWAKSNEVLPDIISWHEFNDPRNIPACVSDMRAFLKTNGIKIKRFSINEIVGGHHLTKPGPTAQYLWAIEEAGIESAAHSCWEDEEKGVYGCGTDSLDGILTPREKKPRSTWWVYRRYADVTGVLVQTDACPEIRAIAGRDDSKNQVAVLIGCNGQEKFDVRIRFVNLDRMKGLRDEVRVRVERIPDLGWKHLPEPQVIQDTVRPLFGNEIIVVVPSLGPNDACFVRLSAK